MGKTDTRRPAGPQRGHLLFYSCGSLFLPWEYMLPQPFLLIFCPVQHLVPPLCSSWTGGHAPCHVAPRKSGTSRHFFTYLLIHLSIPMKSRCHRWGSILHLGLVHYTIFILEMHCGCFSLLCFSSSGQKNELH